MSLAYQVGVFISRSSVSLLKFISYLWIFTAIQIGSFIFWFILAITGFIANFPLYVIYGVIVGLAAGGSYVLGYYLFYEDKSINSKLKELSINISFNVSDIMLILSSVVSLILDNIVLKVN